MSVPVGEKQRAQQDNEEIKHKRTELVLAALADFSKLNLSLRQKIIVMMLSC